MAMEVRTKAYRNTRAFERMAESREALERGGRLDARRNRERFEQDPRR